MSYFSDISVITTKQGLKELTKNEIFHDMVTAEDIAFLKEDVYLFCYYSHPMDGCQMQRPHP